MSSSWMILSTASHRPLFLSGVCGASLTIAWSGTRLNRRSPSREVVGQLRRARQNIVMLELRPTCENCNAALPPNSADAMICTFECTFCRSCVENILDNVCPNCGGGFCSRPIRPKNDWKGGDYLDAYPASTTVKHRPVDPTLHKRFAESIKSIPPELR